MYDIISKQQKTRIYFPYRLFFIDFFIIFVPTLIFAIFLIASCTFVYTKVDFQDENLLPNPKSGLDLGRNSPIFKTIQYDQQD